MRRHLRHLGHALLLALLPLATAAQTLRVGLAEDPDVLDPTLARSFVGRIVFAGLCDKLFDIDEKLQIVPQLATAYEWSADSKALTLKIRPGVTFHDGEKLDAAAVKFNIERHKTMAGSNRRGELAPVTTVDVVDPMTVRLNLSAPFSPLLAQLSDRAGMIVSPKAAQAEGDKFGSKPVCSGPFKFVERIAQDRIVLEKYAGYWNKEAIHFDKVVYTPIPDATVRLANLRSGQLDFIERVASSDFEKLKSDRKLKTASITEIGYQGLTINVGKSEKAQQNPLGKDPRVREALELSIDRQGLAQVVMDNEAQVGNQWVAPSNAWYAKNVPLPKRDIARAKALLKEAGVPRPSFTIVAPTTSDAQRLAVVIQAMTREAGFDVKIQAAEFATSLNMADKGDFEAYVLAWSGRPDPDGNLFSFHGCKQPLNYSGYCDAQTDALLVQSRATRDPAERKKVFEQIAARVLKERPIIYLYHRNWLWAYNGKLGGVRSVPDGLLRVAGLKMAPEGGIPRLALARSMLGFLARRLGTVLPTLVLVSMLIFGLQQLLPGDPAKILAGEEQDPTVIAYLHQKLHLDEPLPVRYAWWVGGVLRGDLGESVRNQQPVLDLVLQKLPVTFELALLAMAIALVIGIPAGVAAAVGRGGAWDVAANAFALWGLSTPNFWLGILMILLFSVQLGWLPASGYVSPFEDLGANLASMIMPAFVLGNALAAVLMRHTRSAMLQVLSADYIRTARSKGLAEAPVILRHALRNALVPVVTLGALEFGTLLSGAVLTEQVFTIPGFGKLIVDAVFNRDYAVVQGVVLVTATTYIALNLLADLAYFALNPRLRA